jgi:DUF4097 and DUF4098 domain-containing protein YvlB
VKRSLGLLVLLAAVFGSWAFAKEKKAVILPAYAKLMKIQKEQQRSFTFMPGGRLNINTAFMGNVTIEGWDKPRIRVDATISAWGNDNDELIKNVEAIAADFSKSPTDIRIVTQHPADFMLGSIDYRIMVPRFRTDIKIKSNRGFISVRDVNGWLEADTGTGYISMVNLRGYVSTKTVQGDILIQLDSNRWEGLSMNATTQTGDVKVLMPTEYNTDLTLISLVGEVIIDYPVFQINEVDIALVPVQKKQGMYLNQRVRDGGHPVTAQTENGTVKLMKYDPNLEIVAPPAPGTPQETGEPK